MPIRETLARGWRRSTLSVPAAAALALVGCGPAAPQAKQPAANGSVADAGKSADCLASVWQAQAAPDRAFDRAHDRGDGGSISCATGTSASQFAAALAAIRQAARHGDKAALADAVSLPLLYIDGTGRKRELDRDTLAAEANQVFSPAILALLSRIALDDLSFVPQQGAFGSLGAVWLVSARPGGPPRIVTIDRQALDEATAAKRRRLGAAGGTPSRTQL